MSSIPTSNLSTNPGLADLLQNLANTGSSALASALSSPSVQAALEQASPGDLVQLSDQALQLQVVGSLFGDQSNDTADPTSSLFDFLDPGLAATNAATSTSLFGTSTTSANANSLLDFLDPSLAAAVAGTGTTAGTSTASSAGLANATSDASAPDNAALSSLFNLQA
jgi:hypothetical protein